jgi:hypothetical protein
MREIIRYTGLLPQALAFAILDLKPTHSEECGYKFSARNEGTSPPESPSPFNGEGDQGGEVGSAL